jgi:hypothetical protein
MLYLGKMSKEEMILYNGREMETIWINNEEYMKKGLSE